MTSDLVWVAERKTTEFQGVLVKLHPQKEFYTSIYIQDFIRWVRGSRNFPAQIKYSLPRLCYVTIPRPILDHVLKKVNLLVKFDLYKFDNKNRKK